MLLRERLLRSQSVACAEVPAGAFKALAGSAPTKNLPNGETLWSVFQDGSNETTKITRARHASVNEPSGARLFSGDWVEIGHCAHDHGAQFELRRELGLSQRRFSLLPEVNIESAQVCRERRPREELDFARFFFFSESMKDLCRPNQTRRHWTSHCSNISSRLLQFTNKR